MEDYQRAVERLECFAWASGHEVVVRSVRPLDLAERAAQIGDAEVLVLIRERTPIDAPLLALLPHLRLICQTGRGTPHIDIAACTRRGIVVCTGTGSPYAPAELTLALILASEASHRPTAESRSCRREAGRAGRPLQGSSRSQGAARICKQKKPVQLAVRPSTASYTGSPEATPA